MENIISKMQDSELTLNSMTQFENQLIQYFSKITKLTAEEEKSLIEGMDIHKFTKGDYLVQEGKRNDNTFFVLQGIVREFKLIEGDEKTTNFYTEEQWIMSLAGISGDDVAKNNLICVEDTWVVVGNEEKAMQLFKVFPRFETLSRQIVEESFISQQKLMATYITDKPEQRYLNIIKTRPSLIQRVPQYDIASYIGVKPESLSRIRKKIAENS